MRRQWKTPFGHSFVSVYHYLERYRAQKQISANCKNSIIFCSLFVFCFFVFCLLWLLNISQVFAFLLQLVLRSFYYRKNLTVALHYQSNNWFIPRDKNKVNDHHTATNRTFLYGLCLWGQRINLAVIRARLCLNLRQGKSQSQF